MEQSPKLHEYFAEWMRLYKRDAVQPITYQKYEMTHRQLCRLAPDIRMNQMSRLTYQKILNEYAKTHERQTVMNFYRHVRSSITVERFNLKRRR